MLNNTKDMILKVNPQDICYLDGLINALDNKAILRTKNVDEGIIELWISPDYYSEIYQFINDIKDDLGIIFV